MSTGHSSMTASTVQQEQKNIVAGDWDHLTQVLRSAGLSEPELDELSAAVKHDEKKLGPKVKEWISKVGPKVLSGGVAYIFRKRLRRGDTGRCRVADWLLNR